MAGSGRGRSIRGISTATTRGNELGKRVQESAHARTGKRPRKRTSSWALCIHVPLSLCALSLSLLSRPPYAVQPIPVGVPSLRVPLPYAFPPLLVFPMLSLSSPTLSLKLVFSPPSLLLPFPYAFPMLSSSLLSPLPALFADSRRISTAKGAFAVAPCGGSSARHARPHVLAHTRPKRAHLSSPPTRSPGAAPPSRRRARSAASKSSERFTCGWRRSCRKSSRLFADASCGDGASNEPTHAPPRRRVRALRPVQNAHVAVTRRCFQHARSDLMNTKARLRNPSRM